MNQTYRTCSTTQQYTRGGQPVRDQEPHFFTSVLPQRTTTYTWAHMNISPSLPHPHTYLCITRIIVNITHQHDNDRTLQKAIYCYACHLVGLLVITQESHETGQRATCNHATTTTVIYYI